MAFQEIIGKNVWDRRGVVGMLFLLGLLLVQIEKSAANMQRLGEWGWR